MKHISSERKTNIINRYYNGDPVAELTEATGIARSTIYGWLKADRESAKKPVTMVNAVKVFTLRLCISAYYIHFKRVKVKIFTAFTIIDKNMVKRWVEDLVITKTYNGLYFQQAILQRLSTILGLPYRLATAEEESKGIDGYVGDTAYSVKPDTFKSTNARSISEDVNVKMIYYTKKKTGITVEIED